MTRARDELILSHAADYGGARARAVSPFVLEALDLPAAATPGAGAIPPSAEERLAGFAAVDAPVEAERGPIDEPLSLSFGQIDAYLTCPLKYKYAHVLRVPTAPHHALVYGAAMHKVVQLFHHRHARGHVMSRGGARRGPRLGLVERGVREPRARGGTAGRRLGRPCAGSARSSCSRARSSRPTSSASSASPSAATGSAADGTGSMSSRSPDAAATDCGRRARRRRPPTT